MQELFNTFSTLNIEYRLGNILSVELMSLQNEFHNHSYSLPSLEAGDEENEEADPKEKRLKRLFSSYSQEIFSGGILNDELIYLMLVEGIYPKSKIRDKIKQSRYFQEKANIEVPAWLKIQSFDYLDDEVVNNSKVEMLKQFENREVTETGTMLHMFHLMFLMSYINVIDKSLEETLNDCKKYIDDLVNNNKLPFDNPNESIFDSFLESSAHGHGFWLYEVYSQHINEIRKYIKIKRKEALINNYPEFSREIMQALNDNLNEFKLLLIGEGSTLGKYSRIDILSTIPPEDFVLTWLCKPYNDWDRIRNILINRYTNGIAKNILASEKEWLRSVIVTLKIEAMKLEGFERLRIERLIPARAMQYL